MIFACEILTALPGYIQPILDSQVLSLARKSLKVFKRFIDIKELYNMELPYRLGTVRQFISYTLGGFGVAGLYKKQKHVKKSLSSASDTLKWRLQFCVHLTNLLKAIVHSLRYFGKNVLQTLWFHSPLGVLAHIIQVGAGGSKGMLMAEKLVTGGKRPTLYYALRFAFSVLTAMFSFFAVLFFFQIVLIANSTYLFGTTGILIGSFFLDLYKYLH